MTTYVFYEKKNVERVLTLSHGNFELLIHPMN